MTIALMLSICVIQLLLIRRVSKVEKELADIRTSMEDKVEQDILNEPVWNDDDFKPSIKP